MATTVFRVVKDKNFTTISNFHLQDKTLSLKAKGMLTLMLSLNAKEWDMTLKGLATLSHDGLDSTRSTVKELEEHGYLKRTIRRNELGRMEKTEYTVYERSIYADELAPTVQADENVKGVPKTQKRAVRYRIKRRFKCPQADISANADTTPHIGKSDAVKSKSVDAAETEPTLHVGKSNTDTQGSGKNDGNQVGFSNTGKPNIGQPHAIKDLNNKILNNKYIANINPSSDMRVSQNDTTVRAPMDKIDGNAAQKVKKDLEEREAYTLLIKENIDYEGESEACRAENDVDRLDFLNLCLSVMVNAVMATTPYLTVGKQEFPTETVKSQMLKLRSEHIDYVYMCLQRSDTEIRDMQKYILTCLYNSLHGAELYYSQWVKHDQAKADGTAEQHTNRRSRGSTRWDDTESSFDLQDALARATLTLEKYEKPKQAVST